MRIKSEKPYALIAHVRFCIGVWGAIPISTRGREVSYMGMAEFERKKDEKINGIIYDMSLSPGYGHFMVDGNLYTIIKQGLKGSICRVSIENLDFQYHLDINFPNY